MNDSPPPASLALVLWRNPAGAKRGRYPRALCDALLHAACARLPDGDPEAVIGRNQWSKPVTDGAWLSLTHGGAWMAAAASSQRVGIDIEVEQPRPFDRIARKLGWPVGERGLDAPGFYLRWTLWEAALKAQRRHARDLVLRLPRQLQASHNGILSERGTSGDWWAVSGYPEDGVRLSLVGAGGLPPVTLTLLEQLEGG